MKRTLDRAYLFLIICSSAFVFTRLFSGFSVLQAGGTATALHSDSSNPILFAISFLIVSSTLLLSFGVWPAISTMFLQTRILLCLYCLGIASISWSVSPPTSFRAMFYMVIYLIGTAYVAIRLDLREILRVYAIGTTLLAAGSVIAQFTLPDVSGGVPGWTGLFSQKNFLGVSMAIGLLAIIMQRKRWTLPRIGSFALCLAVLFLSESSTALYCLIAGASTFYFFRVSRRDRLLATVMLAGIILAALVLVPALTALVLRASGKNETLTGRNVIWAFSLRYIADRPFFGYGYSAFWSEEAGYSSTIRGVLGWNPGYAHNSYIDIMLNIGVVGLVGVSVLIFHTFGLSRRLRDAFNENGIWLLMVLEVLLLHGIAECDFLLLTPLWTIFTVSYFAGWRALRQARFQARLNVPHLEVHQQSTNLV